MRDVEKDMRETAWSYRPWAAEMAPVVQRILEGRQETSPYSGAEAWLAYLLCVTERSVYREEIVKESKSLDIPLPPEHEIDWAFEHLKARGWLLIAFGIEDAKKNGWQGEFVYRLRPGVRIRLTEITGDLSVHQEAHRRLKEWLSRHPPDSAREETVLAYALYLNESSISLAKVLEEMDAINIGFPNAYLLGAAFLRLRKRGWLVVEGEDSYGLSPEAKRLMDTLVQRRTYMGGSDENLRAWMIANPPPGYEREPIGDSYVEDLEEMAQVLQSKGFFRRGRKGKGKRV